MPPDPLNTILHILRLEPKKFYRLQLASPWGMSLSPASAAFHFIEHGECWLRMPGNGVAQQLRQGDIVVVANTAEYHLVSGVDAQAFPLREVLASRDSDGIVRLQQQNGEPALTMVCTEFYPEGGAASPMFSVIPPVIYIPNDQGRAIDWLAAPLELIAFETRHDYPATSTVVSRVMDILFIMVIRYWITHHQHETGGWLKALYHPQIGEVMGAMHQQPEHPWTVEDLAKIANMSRSSLAKQFTAMVGESPMKYLTRWRMQLAAMWLVSEPDLTIDAIALRVGYTSGYAFSKAFKRMIGDSPDAYRRQRQLMIR